MASALPVPPVRGHARRQRIMAVSDVIGLRVLQLRQRTFAHAGLQHADPWADERVLSFVCAVPQQVVQRQSSPKHLTREAMRGVLPDAARTSPAPSNQYPLYQRAFVEREVATVRELMRDSRADAAGLLDAGAVLATYESLLRGEPVYHDFWYPLTVELWLRRWWG
jgi:asparagine synthase (glutamine-hydrolysing)